jgi:hypothetical protein
MREVAVSKAMMVKQGFDEWFKENSNFGVCGHYYIALQGWNAALLHAAWLVENSTSHCDMGPVSKELHCSMLADLLREKATTDQQASPATPQSET